jgi:hypothetical protein
MVYELSIPAQNPSIPITPEENKPTLRPWCTPHLQQLGKTDTSGEPVPGFFDSTALGVDVS